MDKTSSTSIRDLLFGVSWFSTLKTLGIESKKVAASATPTSTKRSSAKSIVFTYAITIALRNYDRKFLDELKQKLESKFGSGRFDFAAHATTAANAAVESVEEHEKHIYNLQYTFQGREIEAV